MVPPATRGPSVASSFSKPAPAEALFAGLFGLLLGLGLLKFGNPVILDHLVERPRSLEEWRAFAWPIRYGYLGLLATALAAAVWLRGGFRWHTPAWLTALACLWIGSQLLSAFVSIDPAMTRAVLPHFIACAVCWVLGQTALSNVQQPRVFWLCLVLGFLGVLGLAADQRFGGLEATRKMILESPNSANLPAEYLARIRSNRVFSTLVYPNALAGAVLLLLPTSVILASRFGSRWEPHGSRVIGGAVVALGLATLVWSGSKAGWLIAMVVGLCMIALQPWPRPRRAAVGASLLLVGSLGFGLLYGNRLRQGPTSVVARMDYWRAAVQGIAERPLLGHGPGAFKKVYASRKRPESEMAQLAHNDYLQQAVDSGAPGFIGYLGLVAGSIVWLYRKRGVAFAQDPLTVAVWLGVSVWFAQGMMEFGLYIPATAWPAFTLLGWLTAQPPSTRTNSPNSPPA